ncbi:MAG TPA: hypothetical protein VGM39_24320 [Kofleriaceae bacterium]|jgi:hypothetical protein
MRIWTKVGVVLVLLASVSVAENEKPAKGFWKILVAPKAKWVLEPHAEDRADAPTEKIVIETYDVRSVGDSDVARLRWTTEEGAYTDGADDLPTQIAVTSKGMYLLRADMDDAAVTAALTKAPSRSDPPKPYKGTARNHGRYLRVAELGVVCMGWSHVEADGECDERCEGEICISPTDGIVSLDGTYVPQDSWYLAKSYKADYAGDTTLHFRKHTRR